MRTALLVAFLVLVGFGCAPKTLLPEVMPSNMTIVWREGGGDWPEGSDATISLAGGERRYYGGDKADETVSFVVDADDFVLIYATLRAYAADTVDDSASVFNGDNAGYRLTWDENVVDIWGEAVVAADQERYAEIYDAIGAYVNAATASYADWEDGSAGEMCIQVIAPARNPQTGETRDFPTPCDVPEGWEVVSGNVE